MDKKRLLKLALASTTLLNVGCTTIKYSVDYNYETDNSIYGQRINQETLSNFQNETLVPHNSYEESQFICGYKPEKNELGLDLIKKAAIDADVTIYMDTNHSDVGIKSFFAQETTIKAMADAGYTELHLEYRPLESGEDIIFQFNIGKIEREEFLDLFKFHTPLKQYEMTDEELEQSYQNIADTIELASKHGIYTTAIDGGEYFHEMDKYSFQEIVNFRMDDRELADNVELYSKNPANNGKVAIIFGAAHTTFANKHGLDEQLILKGIEFNTVEIHQSTNSYNFYNKHIINRDGLKHSNTVDSVYIIDKDCVDTNVKERFGNRTKAPKA